MALRRRPLWREDAGVSLPALELLGHATKIGAAVLAVALARVQRRNRPLAAVLVWSVVADLARMWIGETILEPTRAAMRAAGHNPADIPFTGAARLAFHIDAALFLSWSAGLAVVALAVLARRRAWPVVVVWAAASIALAVTYPLTRGEVLRRCYLAAEFAALAVTVEGVRAWFARVWREGARRIEVPETAALVLPAVEVAILILGPWRRIFDAWTVAMVGYSVEYAFLSVLFLGGIWTRHTSSSWQA
jgi:hypothetical protein